MQKTGQVEKTVDREFLDEEAKFKTWVIPRVSRQPTFTLHLRFEKEVEKLQKEAKQYIDSMRSRRCFAALAAECF